MQGKSTRIGAYKCYACRSKFTVKIGTIFEDSHIPMRFWLQAIFLLASSKKGISSNQLHRTFGISLRSAWFMSHRLREAMRSGPLAPMGGAGGSGVIEVDETIYGRAATHPKGRGPFGAKVTNAAHKNVILSLVERGGQVRSYHVAGSTVSEVIPIVTANVAKEAAVMTDSAQLYKQRLGDFASHDRVDHSKGEYARYEEGRPIIHTNTVESYFSIFKRGMRGTYQHCKEKHLHRYLGEFDFRHNARVALGVNDRDRAEKLLRGVKGKRLTYR
jgi:transposase-like protein